MVLSRVANGFTVKEIINRLIRFRFKVVDVFGYKVKIPIKNVIEFEQYLDNLKIMVNLMGYNIKIKSNHTLIEIMFTDGNSIDFQIDLELYFGFIANPYAGFKPNSKLKKIELKTFEGSWYSNDNYYLVLKKAIETI